MIHYTPLDASEIFPQEPMEQKLITYEGRNVYVAEIEPGKLCIQALVSTNPADYLNPTFTPGKMITYDTLIETK